MVCMSLFSSKQSIIKQFGFCDILNNQGLGKCYQPSRRPRLITLTDNTRIYPKIQNLLEKISQATDFWPMQ